MYASFVSRRPTIVYMFTCNASGGDDARSGSSIIYNKLLIRQLFYYICNDEINKQRNSYSSYRFVFIVFNSSLNDSFFPQLGRCFCGIINYDESFESRRLRGFKENESCSRIARSKEVERVAKIKETTPRLRRCFGFATRVGASMTLEARLASRSRKFNPELSK